MNAALFPSGESSSSGRSAAPLADLGSAMHLLACESHVHFWDFARNEMDLRSTVNSNVVNGKCAALYVVPPAEHSVSASLPWSNAGCRVPLPASKSTNSLPSCPESPPNTL